MPDNSEKQERARTPEEQRLWQEREEEIAAFTREAELRRPRLKFINSDGRAVDRADWEGRAKPEIPKNDLGMSLLGAFRQIVAQALDGDRLVALFRHKLAFHIRGAAAQDSACNMLKQGGAQNLFEAEGFREEIGRESSIAQTATSSKVRELSLITPAEWQTWKIDVWRQRLVDPTGTRMISNVWIKDRTAVAHLRETIASVMKPQDIANKHDGSKPKASAKTRCKASLVNLMFISPNKKPKSKAEFQLEAKSLFGTSERQFLEAWNEAVEETGAKEWSAPGRPPKNPRTN
jgi:hypothetical protein